MLTESQMRIMGLPIHSYHQTDNVIQPGWVESTIDAIKGSAKPTKLLAIDCEMVRFVLGLSMLWLNS